MVRARETLAAASPRAPLLVAFVEALRARGAFALIATHFDAVAAAAQVPHLRIAGLRERTLGLIDANDLNAALDAINAAMDYRIVGARDGDAASDALELARLLGLDDDVIARARALYETHD